MRVIVIAGLFACGMYAQTWTLQLNQTDLSHTGGRIFSDGKGVYDATNAPANVTATAAVHVDQVRRGREVREITTSVFTFSVINPLPGSAGDPERQVFFSGIDIDSHSTAGSMPAAYACRYPRVDPGLSHFPWCLADFINPSSSTTGHPQQYYREVRLALDLPDFDFMGMETSTQKSLPSRSRLAIYEKQDCIAPVYAGIGQSYDTPPNGITLPNITITRNSDDQWTIDVNQPLKLAVFGYANQSVGGKNRNSCTYFLSPPDTVIWTNPVAFSMTWTRQR